MDFVTEFKKKVKTVSEKEGVKYKILYKGYENALKENRLHVFWHAPGIKLAEITIDGEAYVLSVGGEFKGAILDNSGNEKASYVDSLTPDESLELMNDHDVEKFMEGHQGECRYVVEDFSYLEIARKNNADDKMAISETSIAKALFDIDSLKNAIELLNAVSDGPIEDVIEEPDEEPAEEAVLEETEPEQPKETAKKQTKKAPAKAKKSIAKNSLLDKYSLDTIFTFLGDCIPEADKEVLTQLKVGDKDNLLKAAKAFAGLYFDNMFEALSCSIVPDVDNKDTCVEQATSEYLDFLSRENAGEDRTGCETILGLILHATDLA